MILLYLTGEDGKCMKVRRVTFAQKQQCWERIQQKLASLGISPQERSAKEIKKRKECMFSKIKKKVWYYGAIFINKCSSFFLSK